MAKSKRLLHKKPQLPMDLITLRWFMLTIEQTSLEAYATNPGKNYKPIVAVLTQTVKSLRSLATPSGVMGAQKCPDGWEDCGDFCAPMCDEVEAD
jgi:hypothetical protein